MATGNTTCNQKKFALRKKYDLANHSKLLFF